MELYPRFRSSVILLVVVGLPLEMLLSEWASWLARLLLRRRAFKMSRVAALLSLPVI